MKVSRFSGNPIITPKDVKPSVDGYEVICAFNAGAIEFNGETILLMRVAERPVCDDENKVLVPVLDTEDPDHGLKILNFSVFDPGIDVSDPRIVLFPDAIYLTSISNLRIARSRDGYNFTIDEKPALIPEEPYESFGLEDPRITKINDTYYVVYKGVSPTGITQCLASTKDFVNWEKHGIIFAPENMDAMIFPEKIRGKYVALHRPQPKMIGAPNMWVAYSEDLIHWGEHKFVLGCSSETWESGRIGGGAVPFLTNMGWLEIYHAATHDDHYCLGAILMDKEYPEKVIAKSPQSILQPEAEYEVHGFKDNVIFTCGAVVNGDNLRIYYGAADEAMAVADMSVSEILSSLQPV